MSGWKSYEEIKEDYVRKAKKKNPERGQEIGEIFFFLSSKLLFMKHSMVSPNPWTTKREK